MGDITELEKRYEFLYNRDVVNINKLKDKCNDNLIICREELEKLKNNPSNGGGSKSADLEERTAQLTCAVSQIGAIITLVKNIGLANGQNFEELVPAINAEAKLKQGDPNYVATVLASMSGTPAAEFGRRYYYR